MGAGRSGLRLSLAHELMDVRVRDACAYAAGIFGRNIGIDSGDVHPWSIGIYLSNCSVGISERAIINAVVYQVIITRQREVVTILGVFSRE